MFATSLVFSGYGLAIFTLVPLSQLLVDAYGWRRASLRLGLSVLALLAPLLMLPWSLIRAGDPRNARAPKTGPIAFDNGLTLLKAIRQHACLGMLSINKWPRRHHRPPPLGAADLRDHAGRPGFPRASPR